MGLYGANGELLVQPLNDPKGRNVRMARNKAITENWLALVTWDNPGDGRGDHNWSTPPKKCLTQKMIDDLRARGIAPYVGAGQFFLADLTGKNPVIRQRRPLAERRIELVQPEDMGTA